MDYVLGTANLCNEYGRNNKRYIGRDESFDILDRAYDRGIRWLDVSTNYNNLDMICEWQEGKRSFNLIGKGNTLDDLDKIWELAIGSVMTFMAHTTELWKERMDVGGLDGVSLYDPEGFEDFVHKLAYAEVPVNIYDTRWVQTICEHTNKVCFIARSVFLQGELWKMGLSEVSLNFVRSLPVDYIIIGADSPDQIDAIMDIPQYDVDYTALARGEEWRKQK